MVKQAVGELRREVQAVASTEHDAVLSVGLVGETETRGKVMVNRLKQTPAVRRVICGHNAIWIDAVCRDKDICITVVILRVGREVVPAQPKIERQGCPIAIWKSCRPVWLASSTSESVFCF